MSYDKEIVGRPLLQDLRFYDKDVEKSMEAAALLFISYAVVATV